MDKDKSHPYQQDWSASRLVCVCGRYAVDRVHSKDVVKITGIAKPTKTGKAQ